MTKTELKFKRDEAIVLEFIIKITKMTNNFMMSNRTISNFTKLSQSRVNQIIQDLDKEEWFTKTSKPRLRDGAYSGTTRTIKIDLEAANNYLNTLTENEKH